MQDKVAIVKCASYSPSELYDSIKRAISLSLSKEGGNNSATMFKGKTVLLKPNILSGAAPEKAVTTHPEFVKQCIICIKEMGAEKVIAGDSPGYQSSDYAGRKSGIMKAVTEAGGEWEDFSDNIEVKNPEGLLVKSFNLASVVKKADIIVSLPKMKTHQLLYYTGGMKNLFGMVPGLQKSAFHLRFQERELFAKMVVDLNIALKPAFTIMDAVTAMEGPGPGSGDPRHVGVVLASNNILALDIAAVTIMGYNPEEIPTITEALESKEWFKEVSSFDVVGEKIEDVKIDDFKKIKILNDITMFRSRMPSILYKVLRKAVVKKPVINHKKCVKCDNCIEICPAKIISYLHKKIIIDYKKCITCYCCHEVCPVKAIDIK
ncbi:MAG: DUF362 domain-containing protein [Spirochaetaceae bacterium]|nr:DUF362 domain-containing protein [Spirochaetaceae bacterium]